MYGHLGGPAATAAGHGAIAGHTQNVSAAAASGMHHQSNGPFPPSSGLVAGTTAALAHSLAPAAAHCIASLEAVAAAPTTGAVTSTAHFTAPANNSAAWASRDAGALPLLSPPVAPPAPHPPAANPSMWSSFAAAAADPAFFSHLSNLLAPHQQHQHQQPSFSIDPLNTGLNASNGHTAPTTFAGTVVNTTAPTATAPAHSHLTHLDSTPGSPSFLQSTLSGALSNAAAQATAAFSNASLGTSFSGEAGDKTCSHCGKVEQRQWRKRGDGTLLCNRCFMWRRNHGGVALPPLDPASLQPAITKQHSVGVRISSSGSGSPHSRHARHSSSSLNRGMQDLAGLQGFQQELCHGSGVGSGGYSVPSSPALPRSRSGSAASSPARRRRTGSPDDPEYRPRGTSKLNRSTSHASNDYTDAAAAAARAWAPGSGHNMQQQPSKPQLRSRLAKAGGSGAWKVEEETGMGHPAGRSAEGRQLQHQGSSSDYRLAAAVSAAAGAESDEEVVSAAEVLAGLLSMGGQGLDDSSADQQEPVIQDHHGLAAAAVRPPPTSITAHQGGVGHHVVDQQPIEKAAARSSMGAAELTRSRPGDISGSWMGRPSTASVLGQGSIAAGGVGMAAILSLTTAAAPPVTAVSPKGQPRPLLQQQQQPGGLPSSSALSPAANAKAEQVRAAAAAGIINQHVCRAILAALAAGAPAESIDLASTQRKFELMEQQLRVPHSPAAAHLLSRMSGRSP